MTLTDEALVRSLTEQVDRALPPMSLDPAEIVADGRRHRRHRTAIRAVGGLGVMLVALAVVVTQLPADRGAPAGPEQFVAHDLTFTAAVTAVETETNAGTLYDLGVPYEAMRPDGDHLALEIEADHVLLRRLDTSTGIVGEAGIGLGYTAPPTNGAAAWVREHDAVALGVTPPGTAPEVLVDGVLVGTVPTFEVPGVAGEVFLVSVSGEASTATWPVVLVRFGTEVDGTYHEVSLEQGPPRSTAGPTVELAPGVMAVRAPNPTTLDDGRSGVDLGVRVPAASGGSVPLALVPLTDAELAELSGSSEDGPHFDAGVWVTASTAPGADGLHAPWMWNDDTESVADDENRWDGVIRTSLDESGLFVGVVPQGFTDPRVVLYSQAGFVLADGRRAATLEAPVYASPTGDGRLMYTVWIPAPHDDVDGFATDVDATFAIGSDGTVVPGQRCAGLTLDECAEILGPDVYDAARAD